MDTAGPAPLLLAAEPSAYPFLTLGLYLSGALIVGALVIVFVNRWRKRAADDRFRASDQMAQFRSLYEKGEISQEEYESLRRVLGGELRRAVRARKGPDAAPAAASPPPEAPASTAEPTPPGPEAAGPAEPPATKPPEPDEGVRPA
jgi:hypothetical protein